MYTKTYDFATITCFPELAKEMSKLLGKLGKVKKVKKGMFDTCCIVTVRLHKPATVVNWRERWGEGVAINSDTNACISCGVSVNVRSLPKSGDKEVELTFSLELDSRSLPVRQHKIGVMREYIRDFAALAAKGWYYHFK